MFVFNWKHRENSGKVEEKWEEFSLESERKKVRKHGSIWKENFWQHRISERVLEVVCWSERFWRGLGIKAHRTAICESVAILYKFGYFKSSSNDPRKQYSYLVYFGC